MKSQLVSKETTDHDRNEGLDYPFQGPLADGSVVEVADGVLWLRMPMPMALDHINLYLLEDEDGWYILDTGLNTEKTKELWVLVTNNYCKTKPVKGVICTHFHYDHSSLAAWLMQTFNVPLYMTYGEFYTLTANSRGMLTLGNSSQLAFYKQAGVPMDKVDAIFDACRQDPFIENCPPSFNRLRGEDLLTIGKRTWKIVIGEGHSPEHACLYCEDEKLLLAGDQLLPHISSNILVNDMDPQGQQLEDWLRSLKQLQLLHPDTLVLPAHGPVFKKMHVRAQQLIDHHLETLDSLKIFADHNPYFTVFEAMNELFNRKLSPINTLMALGETLAHLNWLESNAKLVCYRENASGIHTYLCAATVN
jgi:glyoxylase-like metal-dependent hydrolase (beta-lactamase superfamily II)